MTDNTQASEDNEEFIVEIAGSESEQKTSPVSTEASTRPELEVDVIDDTPEEDRKHRRRDPGVEPDIPNDEEIASYSESVQKRIKKIKYEYHEERRAKEEAERQREEAIRYAQALQRQHEELRYRYTKGEQVLVNEAKSRVDSDLARAREIYKQAFEAGDADKLAQAQEVIAALAAEKRDIETYKPSPPPPVAPMVSMAPPPPQPDVRTREWAAQNTWFMQDRDMTNYALVVDERLKRQGVDPRSEEYFKALDEAIRKEFPNRFERESSASRVSESARKPSSVVAPANRNSPSAPRNKVTLTKTQVELARRLGITPEGYAKQLLALKGQN